MNAPTATRPLSIRLAAISLNILYKLLPNRAYDSFYNFAFPRYKEWQREQYRQRALRKAGADPRKAETVFKCLKFSLVGWQGLEATYDCTRQAIEKDVTGALVECGVAQGGSALLMALVNQEFGKNQRHLWLFDSYEGLPNPTREDFEGGKTGTHVRPLPKGSCLGTYDDVSRLLFTEHQLSPSVISMVKGWFQDTIPATRQKIGPIAVLRLDGDWYESTKVCFEALFDQVSENGFIILDDYHTCFGCKKATDQFLAARGKSYPIVDDGRGGAYFRKRG